MTTPNFGWPLIQPTDLVTSLPADFEAFADAVDADLDGLNGGTTGQVLTKASATDYDFAFATPAALPITTEGDLIVGDATGVPIRLPVGAAGEVLTSDGDTVSFVAPAASPFSGVKLKANANQSLASSTVVTITWNQEFFDTDSYHNNAVNNSRITIPANKTGFYHVSATFDYQSSSGGTRDIRLNINGSIFNKVTYALVIGADEIMQYSDIFFLTAGDFLEVAAFQDSGGGLNLIKTSDKSVFSAYFIGA